MRAGLHDQALIVDPGIAILGVVRHDAQLRDCSAAACARDIGDLDAARDAGGDKRLLHRSGRPAPPMLSA